MSAESSAAALQPAIFKSCYGHSLDRLGLLAALDLHRCFFLPPSGSWGGGSPRRGWAEIVLILCARAPRKLAPFAGPVVQLLSLNVQLEESN